MEFLSPAGLERRLKRHLLKETQKFFAITTPGFEKILEKELSLLPECKVESMINGGVEFSGPLALVYYANLKLRTANRVLLRVDSFIAKSYPELFNKASRIDWELYAGFARKIAWEVSAHSSRLHHTANIEKTVSDACAAHMRSLGVNATRQDEAPVRFHVRLADDTCTISIDSSGDLLHKRGYRQEIGHAPLRETIAACLLLHAHYNAFPVIADPLCGSGTFLIEAALMAAVRPAGANRSFVFEHWPSFRPALWERIEREASANEKSGHSIRIIGSDISSSAIEQAGRNAERAGVRQSIDLSCGSCFDFNKDGSAGRTGLAISNLPYGKRAFAGHRDLGKFYGDWGSHLKRYCRGWHFGFAVADRSFSRLAGLPVRSELRFDNGGITVYFVSGIIS